MSQIKADTDALRATIAAMRQGSSAIENALQQAAQAMATLQNSRWSGNHRQQAEEVWTRLQAQFAPTIEALNQIAARTERFTNALEEAGRVFGDGSVSASGTTPSAPGQPDLPRLPDLSRLPDLFKDILKDFLGLFKKPEGMPWWQFFGAEATKMKVGEIIGPINQRIQLAGNLFNVGTEALARWAAGPEYDEQITENARRMTEALNKMELVKPINDTIDLLWQGKFDKAASTFWQSAEGVFRGFTEYVDAAQNQLRIIETSEKLSPVIAQTYEALKSAEVAFRQIQEQVRQFFDSARNSFLGLFRFR
jgi:uncharacterized protein YukE